MYVVRFLGHYKYIARKNLVSENTQQLDTKNLIPKRSLHWHIRACIGIAVSLPSSLQRSKDYEFCIKHDCNTPKKGNSANQKVSCYCFLCTSRQT